MIQTEVKATGKHEHLVQVHVPQGDYDAVYAEQLQKISSQVKQPGFRQGKTPRSLVERQFSGKLLEDTASELVQRHYAEVIESTGLKPAVQPELELPAVQPGSGFTFTLKVTTWPEAKVKDLGKLQFIETEVTAGDTDIEAVVERLMKSQVRYEPVDDRAAEQGDRLEIDFTGYVDGEAFEGGKGENVALVLGEGRFIPGFEDGLMGAKPGEQREVEVTFPADYQATNLAGKAARFEVSVGTVARAEPPKNEDDLASLVGFDDAAALRADIRQRLEAEAEQAGYTATRKAALDALLAANEVELPEALVREDVKQTTLRVAQNMRQQGMQPDKAMFEDPGFQQEVRGRAERGLKLSLLLQAVRSEAGIEVVEDDVEAELDVQAKQYPEAQHEEFKRWMRGQPERMQELADQLLERKCVAYIVDKGKTKKQAKGLNEWQAEQEQGQEK
jgi:trigger factor